jgi:hypothetical protein
MNSLAVFWRLTVFAEPVDQYLRTFQWNKVKYRADKSIADLIDSLQKVATSLLPSNHPAE